MSRILPSDDDDDDDDNDDGNDDDDDDDDNNNKDAAYVRSLPRRRFASQRKQSVTRALAAVRSQKSRRGQASQRSPLSRCVMAAADSLTAPPLPPRCGGVACRENLIFLKMNLILF